MKINRRDLLFGTALSLLASPRLVLGQSASVQQRPEARLLDALARNRLPISFGYKEDERVQIPFTGNVFFGPGWDLLVREASAARFTLIGEEHGVAETAQFAAQLFAQLSRKGYSRMAIELSPPIAEYIEGAAKSGGLKQIEDLLKTPGLFTFYNMREEAQFVSHVMAVASKNERVLWGLDREIFSDRYLISKLEPKVPDRARAAFKRLKDASANAWVRFEQTKNPDDLFLLAENPALVASLRAEWPTPDQQSDLIMRTLEESLAIETAERTGGRWPYSQRRTQWMRKNFVDMLQADKTPQKIMMKFGYNHVIRGANFINVFDLGTMVDEVAELTGERAFHIIVLPSPGSNQAVPGQGRSFRAVPTADYDDLGAGDARLTRVLPRADATGHEVIDLRALRPLATRGLDSWNPDLIKTIYGYDAAVIWKGAHASTGLEPS